jgi:hypothetical protein
MQTKKKYSRTVTKKKTGATTRGTLKPLLTKDNKKAEIRNTGVVNLRFDRDPMEGVSDEKIEELVDEVNGEAGEGNMTTEDLRKIIDYGTDVRKLAVERDLDPRHVLSVTLNIASELIAECFAEEEHPRLCTEVFHQFWDRCGLKTDILEGNNDTVN